MQFNSYEDWAVYHARFIASEKPATCHPWEFFKAFAAGYAICFGWIQVIDALLGGVA